MPLETHTSFRDWIDDFITNYDEATYFVQAPTETNGQKSVAAWIIEDVFELPFSAQTIGSYLPGYDIKYRDAYQMIQLSLATELVGGNLYECYADEDGEVKFYKIGADPASVVELYSIETNILKKPVSKVIVIGYDPPPRRYVPNGALPDGYDLFTFASDFVDEEDLPDSETEPPLLDGPRYHTWGEVLGPELCDYNREGYIEYEDTRFDHEKALDKEGEEGGEGVYDSQNWESVSSYMYKITVPGTFSQAGSRIDFQDRTPRFVKLADTEGKLTMGKLQSRQWQPEGDYLPDLCQDPEEAVDASLGVDLPESDSIKFLGVQDVFIYGYKLETIKLDNYAVGDTRVENTSDDGIILKVEVNSTTGEAFRLSKGDDYQIVPKSSEETSTGYKIVFSSNVHPDYEKNFGNHTAGEMATLRISSTSIYGRGDTGNLYHKSFEDYPLTSVQGVLKDGVTPANSTKTFKATVFPLGQGQSGYVVEKIIVVYDWNNPCVALYDENNKVVTDWLKEVDISLYPIINYDPPAPTALNGEILDQTALIIDKDVNTTQNIAESDYMLAMNGLEKGDIKMTLPFLDEPDTILVSKGIFDLVSVDTGKQTTHILLPSSKQPILGSAYGDGVINSIDYSYQDGSQYLITVNTGPMWLGSSGWETSLYQHKTERVQMEGIILAVAPNNFTCTVKLEQLGSMECINGTKDILEQGDRVRLTIHNNPVTT